MPAFMALPGHVLQSELARDVFWSGKQCAKLGFRACTAPVKLSLALTGTVGRGAEKAVKMVSDTALKLLLEVKVEQVRVVVCQSLLVCYVLNKKGWIFSLAACRTTSWHSYLKQTWSMPTGRQTLILRCPAMRCRSCGIR
jgi:hypothetical protein